MSSETSEQEFNQWTTLKKRARVLNSYHIITRQLLTAGCAAGIVATITGSPSLPPSRPSMWVCSFPVAASLQQLPPATCPWSPKPQEFGNHSQLALPFRQPCILTSHNALFFHNPSCVCFSSSSIHISHELQASAGAPAWAAAMPGWPTGLRLLVLLPPPHILSPQLHVSSCNCPRPGHPLRAFSDQSHRTARARHMLCCLRQQIWGDTRKWLKWVTRCFLKFFPMVRVGNYIMMQWVRSLYGFTIDGLKTDKFKWRDN